MHLLGWLAIAAGVPFLFLGVRVRLALQQLREKASKDEGFQLRRPSLSPNEWRQWNREFWGWSMLRIPLTVTLFEGVLLAVLVRIPSALPLLLLFSLVLQIFPVMLSYALHLWLIFRYGRYNLRRFDATQNCSRQILTLFFYTSLWMPVIALWGVRLSMSPLTQP